MEESKLERRSDAAKHLKSVALKLFAEHGIDGVTVREIAAAAGQKNHAALTYHFGSKDALISELIIDGARAIDWRRNSWLDACEAVDGPHSVTEVIEGLVRTSISPDPPPWGECYNRFVVALQISNRPLFMSAIADRWNSGYQRSLHHIRRLMPGVPLQVINKRLVFMGAALGGILASREGELANQSRPHPTWGSDQTLTEVAQSLACMIEQPSGVTTESD
jgi:AcrR family transcriptional regulator